MGAARRRGDYEARKEQAQAVGRFKPAVIISVAEKVDSRAFGRDFFAWWNKHRWTPSPPRSWRRKRNREDSTS